MMAAVVITMAHKHTFRLKAESRAVFANHLPRIGVLNGNSDCTGCVRGGGVFFLDTGLFSPCRRHVTLYP